MRRTLGILRVSNRGQGEAGTYGERSPEFVQRAAALGRSRCRSYRACENKQGVSVDAQGVAELDSMSHGQRGARCSPEFVGEVVGTAAASGELRAAWWRGEEIG